MKLLSILFAVFFYFIVLPFTLVTSFVGAFSFYEYWELRQDVIANPDNYRRNLHGDYYEEREAEGYQSGYNVDPHAPNSDPLYAYPNNGWVSGVMPYGLTTRKSVTHDTEHTLKWFDDTFVRPWLGGTAEFVEPAYRSNVRFKKHIVNRPHLATAMLEDMYTVLPLALYSHDLEEKHEVKVIRYTPGFYDKAKSRYIKVHDARERKYGFQKMVLEEKLPVFCTLMGSTVGFNGNGHMGMYEFYGESRTNRDFHPTPTVPYEKNILKKYGNDLISEVDSMGRLQTGHLQVAFEHFAMWVDFVYFFDGKKYGYDIGDFEGWTLKAVSFVLTTDESCFKPRSYGKVVGNYTGFERFRSNIQGLYDRGARYSAHYFTDSSDDNQLIMRDFSLEYARAHWTQGGMPK